ncbi:hypothetical protein R1flu_025528 [Riccia fluitans]|uniref:TmcB/TmcC TPR repeats domain-containing protein n=1 Tax=Riccia fluitans TaxID=41844 RepID=A0ABD1XY02_9MARC
MLLRSTSTGVLGKLVSPAAPSAAESLFELHTGKTSVPSTPTHASSSAAAAHQFGDETRSIDGGVGLVDWDFENGNHVPWPSFRKVQSESDLQSLCRASSGSSSAFAAAESLLAAPRSSEMVETITGVKKSSWCRRGKSGGIRRGCSLTIIPSARHMEIDEVIAELAESLTPLSTVDTELYEDSPHCLTQSTSRNSNSLLMSSEKMNLELESSCTEASISFSPVSKDRVETTSWEDVYDENDYMVSSLSAEFATFSGRQQEAAGGGTSMAVAVESSRVGLVYGSQQRAAVAEQLLGPMYVTDLGFGSGGRGGAYKVAGGGGRGSEGGRGDIRGVEAHFRKQLEADPENALLLRNYAKFLDEVLKDPHRAEVYYERAILANPTDGEVLGAYAKLIWDVYKDADRAGRYFEQALEATPDDCYLNAAYASFLWASEDDEAGDEEEAASGGCYNDNYLTRPVYGTTAAASA